MTTVNVYLTFNGNCEEAFLFYQSVFGVELSEISRFKDIPPGDDMPPVSPEFANQVMHVSMMISKETALMGSDSGDGMGFEFKQGNNFAITINTHSRQEAERLFQGLSEGGQVTMPLGKTFWTELFGMFTDKFGINWMVNMEPES